MKVLIVEDNQLLAASLQNVLKDSFIVDVASTGEQGLDLAMRTSYGVIVLDLGLPDMDGQHLCRILRDRGNMTPILIATGEKDPKKCVQLLDTGADDYVTKPYNTAVILARLRALIRRDPRINKDATLTVRDLVLNTDNRQVERSGQAILLRKKEFDILEYLVRNRGRAVTRTMILNHVWEAGKESWNNTVDVHIKYLRDKVDKPFANEDPIIKTAYGIGYMVDNSE